MFGPLVQVADEDSAQAMLFHLVSFVWIGSSLL